MEEFNRLIFLH